MALPYTARALGHIETVIYMLFFFVVREEHDRKKQEVTGLAFSKRR